MSFSMASFRPFPSPTFAHMQELIELCQNTQQTLLLGFSDLAKFECAQTGDCCHEWDIPVSKTYYEQWQTVWNQDPQSPYFQPFVIKDNPTAASYAYLRKVENHCVFLTQEQRCHIHTTQGMAAKPMGCQYFPYNAHANPNAYGVVYLEKACHKGFALDSTPMYQLVPHPQPQDIPNHACYQVPLAVSHQWLALVWDALAQSPTTPIHTFQQLGLGLHLLGEQHWQITPENMLQLYTFLLKQLTPHSDSPLPLPSKALQEWATAFFQTQGLDITALFESAPPISDTQKKEFNHFIQVFLNFKISTQIYAHPFHGHLTHCQHAVVIALELYVLQVYLLYLIEEKLPFQAALHRSLRWAERKLGHTTDWLHSLRVHQWNDAQCLNQFYVFLGWDLGA